MNFFEFWPVVKEDGDAFRRYFLSGALVALLYSAAEPFVQFWQRISWRTILWNNFEFGPVVQEMSFKDISYLELWPPLCSANGTICAIFVEGLWGTNLWNYFEFDQWFKEMAFKNISYLELLWPFCSAEQNHLCNFCRRLQEEQFCEIILNLDQWFKRRCRLKCYLTGALAALLFSTAEPFKQFW